MASYGGWTGKTLRVNLSTGKISTEDTIERYKDYLGGTGVGYKVLWDEVPKGTKAYDEANKIVFGVGPLTGTGAPSGGRTSITAIMPTVWPMNLVATGHMGGHWGAELKFAGWDNIIVEGKADRPVWISIMDDKVQIRDAGKMWGNGIFRATTEITNEMGAGTVVAAIGQSGENMVPQSVIMNSLSHSAYGGGVMGAKNLKAIGVRGTGSVKIAADKGEWRDYVKYVSSILAANNQHVVPSSPQPWAEFTAATRWTARKGLYWQAANPPVETGICDPHDMSSIGYRTAKATYDLGPLAEQFNVRQGGCHSCPIRCMVHLDVPSVPAKYGGSNAKAANTCSGWAARSFFPSFPDGNRGLSSIEAAVLGAQLADDYGVWNNYGLQQRTFVWAYKNGLIKEKLGSKEYDSIPWAKLEAGDPGFLQDLYRRIAYKEGELGTMLGAGEGYWAEAWSFPQEWYDSSSIAYWKLGHPKHHSSEDGYQVGVLINMMYNIHAQNHSHTNLLRNGLPLEYQKAIGEKLFGSGDAIDDIRDARPMNQYKAKFAKWSNLRKELDDSLTLCNWMYPLSGSALKERGYIGDDDCESKLYSLVTGDKKNLEEMDVAAERIFNLHRALTIRDMGTKEMRAEHDTAPNWVFDYPKDKVPFTAGHYKMDRGDIELAKNMFYSECGWDGATGTPTRYTYERLGMKEVADGLEGMGLL